MPNAELRLDRGIIHRVARLELAATSEAPRLAREFVTGQAGALPGEVVADAELLVSELVTNAVRHGRPVITVYVDLEPPFIAVSVQDEGRTLPPQNATLSAPTSVSGRGLFLVDQIASRWGITPTHAPPGQAVWFQINPAVESASQTA
jgi:anti-sigma regulatory factor (Ser/Thr protein kinase)